MQADIPDIPAQPPRGERFPDPLTGLKLLRRSLGYAKGKLYLHPSEKSRGVNLYFHGNIDHAFDFDLQRTIDAAWSDLRRRASGDPDADAPDPIKIAVHRYLLCRLPPGRYQIAERLKGGTELFQVWVDDRPPPSEQPEPSDGPIYYPQQLSE